MNGILSIIKPADYTSHDVVNIIRKKLMTKKVGHTGTLDPMAIGVLPICVGKATKLVEYITDKEKEYICEVVFNKTSDTLDIWGAVEDTATSTPKRNRFEESLRRFTGEIEQVPPMFSAIKIDGKKLYEYAREGKTVERKSRKIKIEEIELLDFEGDKARFRVVCSKGTYIRSLIDDIAKDCGSLGIMSFLIRTKSGNFNLMNSITLKDFMELENPHDYLLPLDTPFKHLSRIDLPMSISKQVLNGVKVDLSKFDQTNNMDDKRIYMDDTFLGLGKYRETKLIIDKLLIY